MTEPTAKVATVDRTGYCQAYECWCNAYTLTPTPPGWVWVTCECGHTQQVHATTDPAGAS